MGNAQILFGYAPGASGGAWVCNYGNPPVFGGTSSVNNFLFDSFWCFVLTRLAAPAAGRMQQIGPMAPAFHPLVDPSTPALPVAVVFEDYVAATITAGACETVFGFHDHITLGAANTLVGIGFRAGADHVWHAFVNDCPSNVAPVTIRRDTLLAPLSTTLHRLKIKIDGRTKTITWLIDGAIVDTWTPEAALDQMLPAPGPKCMWSMTYPINGAGVLRIHAGGIPQLRVLNIGVT